MNQSGRWKGSHQGNDEGFEQAIVAITDNKKEYVIVNGASIAGRELENGEVKGSDQNKWNGRRAMITEFSHKTGQWYSKIRETGDGEMSFFWVGFLFWLFIGASIFLLIWGGLRKRAIHLVSSALLFLPIAYYFSGAENAFKCLMFYPMFPLLLAIFFIHKSSWSTNMIAMEGWWKSLFLGVIDAGELQIVERTLIGSWRVG